MRQRSRVLFLSILGASTVLGAAPSLRGDVPDRADAIWRTDLEAARKAALREGKPLLAVFR